MHVETMFCILIQISLTFVPKGAADKNSVGSGDNCVLNRYQAISSTNLDPVHWCIGITSGKLQWGDSLTSWTYAYNP